MARPLSDNEIRQALGPLAVVRIIALLQVDRFGWWITAEAALPGGSRVIVTLLLWTAMYPEPPLGEVDL